MSALRHKLYRCLILPVIVGAVMTANALADDCNNNGVEDADDIAMGTSEDCQPDGVPDECQLLDNDCNGDSKPDECGVQVTCAAELQSPDPDDGSFAESVSISGQTIAVSVPRSHCQDGTNCGSVQIFHHLNDEWRFEQRLEMQDGFPDGTDDRFGSSVAMDSDTLVVGDPWADCDSGSNCGLAHVFRYNGDLWAYEATLIGSDTNAEDNFGHAVQVNGNLIIIGAPRADCQTTGKCGAAYIFRRNGSAWHEESRLPPIRDQLNNRFGACAAIQGNLAVVSDPDEDCPPSSHRCGAVHLFRYDGTAWNPDSSLVAPDRRANALFGEDLSLLDDHLIVGAFNDHCEGTSVPCGAAYIFRRSQRRWIGEARLSTSIPNDRYGVAVGLAKGRAVVGVQYHPCGDIDFCGSAFVYDFEAPAWVQTSELLHPEPTERGCYGQSVAIHGSRVLVGADNLRRAYLFEFDSFGTDCNCNGIADGCELDGNDCNENSVPDECDLTAGASDCQSNGIPDECEPDCNGNRVADECDIAERTSSDCNLNDIPDDCEVGGGQDCNENMVPDLCDVFRQTSEDCNVNAVPDECDLSGGESLDDNSNGVPDECEVPPGKGDGILKNRYITIALLPGGTRSIQVTLLDSPLDPSREGEVWWAGPEVSIPNTPNPALTVARLECTSTPHSQSWTSGFLHLHGGVIVPGSRYGVRACQSDGSWCSAPVIVETGKWGDVVAPFFASYPNQPNFGDITAIVDKFKQAAFAPDIVQADLGVAFSAAVDFSVNFNDISLVVDAFMDRLYPYAVWSCEP